MEIIVQACIWGLGIAALFSTILGIKHFSYGALWVGCVGAIFAVIGFCASVHVAWAGKDAIANGHNSPGARLRFYATTPKVPRKNGEIASGIIWDVRFQEVRAMIVNDTSNEFRDLDVVFRPDHLVAAAAQETEIPNVRVDAGIPEVTVHDGMIPVATNKGVHVRCPKLLPNNCIEIVMATVASPPERQITMDTVSDAIVNPKTLILQTDEGGTKTIYARVEAKAAAYPAPAPRVGEVAVDGTYTFSNDTVKASEVLTPTTEGSDFVKALLAEQKRATKERDNEMRKNGPVFIPQGPPVLGEERPGPRRIEFTVKNTGHEDARIIGSGMSVFLSYDSGIDPTAPIIPAYSPAPIQKMDVVVKPEGTYDFPGAATTQPRAAYYRHARQFYHARIVYKDSHEETWEWTYRYAVVSDTHGGPTSASVDGPHESIRRLTPEE